MRFEEHCAECVEKLGKPFEEVHLWLDEFAFHAGVFDPYHRMARHHEEGIREVLKRWGPEAAEAARLHVLADEGVVPADAMYYRDQITGWMM